MTAIAAGDIYSAAAVYDIASPENQERLEDLMFGQRRNALTLARWEHTPSAVLQALAGSGDYSVKVRLDKNPGTVASTLSQHYHGERNTVLLNLIAQHRSSPEEVLAQMAAHENDRGILKSLCTNPASSKKVIEIVAARFPGKFCSELAVHPEASATLLSSLYMNGNEFVRAAVVSHANCPKNVLDEAGQDGSILIRRHLAANECIGTVLLIRLAMSPDAAVRRAAAGNLALDAVSVEILAQDSELTVRRAVATRFDLPMHAIKRLSCDEDHWVRQRVARNPATPTSVLNRLAADENTEVRRGVARNPACPRKLLKKLAGDAEAWVRSAVAYQKNTPVNVLEKLAEERDVDVLSGVAANPRTPQKILRRLAQSPENDVRRGVILNPQAGRKTLLPLLQDPYFFHRMLLTGNAMLKDKDKWEIHDDPDPAVRFSAMRWFAKNHERLDRVCNR